MCSESVYAFLTEAETDNPMADMRRTTSIGDLPYTRVPAGVFVDNFTRTTLVRAGVDVNAL